MNCDIGETARELCTAALPCLKIPMCEFYVCLTPGSAVCNKTLKIKIIFFVGSVNFIDFTAKGNTPVRVSILLSGEAIQVAK